MNVYTIILERIGTGERSLSMVTRQANEAAARAFADAALAQATHLRVLEMHTRPYDFTKRHPPAWLGVTGHRPQPLLEPSLEADGTILQSHGHKIGRQTAA
jgi:hypothetical protein